MDTDEFGELFETLTLEKKFVDPVSPPFTGYGPNPSWWNYYGHTWQISNYRRRSSVPLNLPKDTEYRNFEGKLHRLYGPAYISQLYEIEAWYKEGKRHREHGPAYIHKRNMIWF